MKIAFFSRNRNFCEPLLEELARYHQLRVWRHDPNEPVNQASINNLLNWCDLAYLEWIQPPNIEISRFQGLDKPLVMFCHGIDVMNHNFVDWQHISGLIIQDALYPRLDMLRNSWHIQNPGLKLPPLPKILIQSIGADTQFFQPKTSKPGYHIILHASQIRATKRVYTAVQQFYDLIRTSDKPWKMTVVGEWHNDYDYDQRREYLEACDELLGILDFPKGRLTIIDKNFSREEWRQFLQTGDIYWCTSWRESFGSSMAEAAASGLYPMVNSYLGADKIYPEANLCKTPGEFVDNTIEWGMLDESYKIELGKKARANILRFDSKKAAEKIRLFLEERKESYRK
jgi:hypothetical protein